MTGHEYFAEVSEDFIEDDFNLTGLSSQIPNYKEALELILDVEPAEEEDEEEDEEDPEALDDPASDEDDMSHRNPIYGSGGGGGGGNSGATPSRRSYNATAIENAAEVLYGLIHQRYITSRAGMSQMHEKYELGHFGHCPRVFCDSAKVLPVGCSDMVGQETVKLFCPSCLDVYTPPNSRFQSVDGAFFGTTFGCLFFMTYADLSINARGNARHAMAVDSEEAGLAAAGMQGSDGEPVYSGAAAERVKNSLARASAASGLNMTSSQLSYPPGVEINGVQSQNFAPGLGKGNVYESRVYGFRVAEISRTGPRMKWLRLKPNDLAELDEVRRYEMLQTGGAEGAMEDDGEVADDEDVDEMDDDEDGHGHGGGGGGGGGGVTGTEVRVAERKMAPMRRRRRVSGDEVTPSGVNGVG